MATPIGSLYASLTMDVGQYASGWALADRITARGAANIRKEAGLAEASVARFAKTTAASSGIKPYGLIAVSRAFERVNDRVGLLRGTMLATTAVFGGLTAALSSNLVLRYADTYNNLTNQIRVVSDDAADLAGQLAAVQAAADNSRSSLQATAVLYSRLAKAAPTKANSEVLEYVQTIQKALALGGATAQEAASAAIQFSQAIASNRLGGEELRAVLETPLGLALAKGLDVTIGKLRQMSVAGELTADKVLGALSKIKGSIDEQFGKSVLTIDQSLVKADNRLTEYIGTLDKTYGLTRVVSGGILAFANNIDKVAGSAVTLGLALGSAFAGRLAGRGVSKGIDSTFGEVKRRAADARDQVEKLTKAQHDLVQQIDRGTRALGSLQGRDNLEFASKSDLKILQREEAKLNKIREDRLATTTRLRDAVNAANAVEVKSSKSTISAAAKIVETQGKIEDSLARQTTLTNELQRAETRLTAAKGQQTLNVANIGAVKEAEKDITRIRQQQIAETTKASQLEESIGNQRVALAGKIGDAEAKAAETRAKYQAIAQTASKQTAKLLTDEYDQTQRVGRARAALGEVGAIGKAAEIRTAEAALGGLRTGLEDTTVSLASAVKGTSTFRQSLSLLKNAGAGLVGFLGGPWGVAFTAATLAMTIFGIRSAEAAQQAENTKKALKDVLGDVASAGGGAGQVAEDSLRTDELKGNLEETQSQIKLFADGADQQSHRIQDALTRAFDPLVNSKLAGRSDFVDLFYSATAGINNLIKRIGAGEVQLEFVNREIRALPEAKFLDDDQIKKLSDAVSEAGKFELALNKSNLRAQQLQTTLDRGLGNINVEAEINSVAQSAIDHMGLYEEALKQSRKVSAGLLVDLQNINGETSSEADIRTRTAAIMKDNKDLLEGEARDVAIVSSVLQTINSSSDEWLRSTEATSGEFARLLATAKQIAPAIDFSKKGLTSTQVAAVTDMLTKQTDLAKKEADRSVIGERERSILEKQDSILDSIRQKYGTIAGVDMSQVNAAASALVDFDRGAGAIQRADAAIQDLKSDTSSLGVTARAAVNKYVVSLNGAIGSLASFRSAQADVVTQIIANRDNIKDVETSLTSYRGELERLVLASRGSLFGKLENTADVRNEIAAVTGGIFNLADRMAKGKLSAHDLAVGMAEIEAKLKALGANDDALNPFIRSVLEAIAKIAKLTGALDLLKRIQGTLGGSTRAGLTGTLTVDEATGIRIHRFGGDSGGTSGAGFTRAIENGVTVTRFGQDQTTAATNAVGESVDTVNQSVTSGLSNVSSGIYQVSSACTAIYRGMYDLWEGTVGMGPNGNDPYGWRPDGGLNTGNISKESHMFGDAWSPETGSYVSSWGIGHLKRPTINLGPQETSRQSGAIGNIVVGDINVNGITDGAEAGRQAAYEFVRTVYGAMSQLST
ncbi:tape measure protein [Mesorhizobium sp. M1B.F.Ca.ET.045.04.1.1]|uniref:tape measure protein n=1 Tax=Mesorhizobium sp. M1B.F.Ca.ET.045.04.1.1 TaxID=2493673 RepID=UPI000F74E32F|nr:tape measure protein [Mesorhizobium sp. M1B.F.Ca.ET.045.04.1.1]AZO29431.1 hypothetical protein EJ071_19900 [Mesorhizobium sp. M1B.F.Ca.ET.045.04.1.1]